MVAGTFQGVCLNELPTNAIRKKSAFIAELKGASIRKPVTVRMDVKDIAALKQLAESVAGFTGIIRMALSLEGRLEDEMRHLQGRLI